MKNFKELLVDADTGDLRGEHKYQSTFLMTVKRLADNFAGIISIASPLGLLCSLPTTPVKWVYLSLAWVMDTVVGTDDRKAAYRNSHTLIYKEVVAPNEHPLTWTGMKKGNAAVVEVRSSTALPSEISLPKTVYQYIRQVSLFAMATTQKIFGNLTLETFCPNLC